MSLSWEWDEKIGIATITRNGVEMPVYLYEGNAFIIMLFEWHNDKENADRWSMYNFFSDKEHAKNCFGISKGHDNLYEDDGEFIRIEIWTDKVNTAYLKDFVGIFSKGLPNIPIMLTHSPEKIDFPHWDA